MKGKENRKFPGKRKSFLFTMVISIVLLICIPLIVIQLWLVQQSISEIRVNHTESYIAALQSNAHSFNSQIKLLNSNALKISDDLKVKKLLQDNANGYDIFLAAQAIKDYNIGLPSVEVTCVYYPSKNVVLTEGYQRTMELFYEVIGISQEAEQQKLLNFLDELVTMDILCLPGADDGGRLLIAKPVHLDPKSEQDSAVMFILDLEDLLNTFRVNLPAGANMAIISLKDDWVLCDSQFPAEECESEPFKQFLNDPQQSFFELRTDEEQMEIYKYVDYSTGNLYLSAMVKEDAQRQLMLYVDRVTAIMMISMLLLVVFFTIAVYINYKPVQKLVLRHSSLMEKSNLSELELLDSAIFAKDNEISSQRNLLASFVLGDLIYGNHVEEDLLDKQFDRNRLRYFAVVTVSSIEMTTSQSNAVAEELWKKLEGTEVYTTGMPNRPHVLFILLSENPIDPVVIKADMLLSLRTVLGNDGVVRVGKMVHNLEDIRESYYSSFMEETGLQVQEISFAGDYPVKEVQYFVQRVCAGDEQEALRSLEQIEILFALRKYRPSYGQYYCYKLLSSFLTGVRENDIPMSEECMNALMEFRNPPKLFALLREAVSDCCNRVDSEEESANTKLRMNLLDYVEKNFCNCDMCLTLAADYMNISTYAVSRLFKEITGSGFKEYVTTKRLDQAYKLLKTTTDTVAEIGRAVGIGNTKYFSTLFKKKYGKSPQQVRNGE